VSLDNWREGAVMVDWSFFFLRQRDLRRLLGLDHLT